MIFSRSISVRLLVFFLLVVLISVVAVFVPKLYEKLSWFHYSNGFIGFIFGISLYIKLKATLSQDKKSPMGQIALTFFLKMFGLIVLLVALMAVGGKALVSQLKYIVLGLFLIYTFTEFVFLQMRK